MSELEEEILKQRLAEYQPKYKAVGWELEYEFSKEMGMHVFYSHPEGIPRECYNIRSLSDLSRLGDILDRELMEAYLTYKP